VSHEKVSQLARNKIVMTSFLASERKKLGAFVHFTDNNAIDLFNLSAGICKWRLSLIHCPDARSISALPAAVADTIYVRRPLFGRSAARVARRSSG
jgi:hypothetical protein